MPEVEYSTTAKLPVEVDWDFVQEMDNWAGFVAGYQRHEKQSETDSTWVLKGDVGPLARTVQFAVHIEEWNGPSRVPAHRWTNGASAPHRVRPSGGMPVLYAKTCP